MKLLDYFNICFIVFVLLCVFFVLNNEYKLNISERYSSVVCPFEQAPDCTYRIVNRLSNGDIYCLCQVRVLDFSKSKTDPDYEKFVFYFFEKFDKSKIHSCVKHKVKYSKETVEDSLTREIIYSNESEESNLKNEEDINKVIFKILKNNKEILERIELDKTFSFRFEFKGSGKEKMESLINTGKTLKFNKYKIIGEGNKYLNLTDIKNGEQVDVFKIYDNSTKKKSYYKSYSIILNSYPNITLMNKNGYTITDFHSGKSNILDYYKNNDNIILTGQNICGSSDKYFLLTDKKAVNNGEDYFNTYDKTSQIKKDLMCPEEYPYPYDTFMDNKKNSKFKYRYDIVNSRSRCCSVVPKKEKNQDLNGPKSDSNEDEYEYETNAEINKEEEDELYDLSDENQPIYMKCNGDSIECKFNDKEGKCNMYDIQKFLCVPGDIEKNIFNFDDVTHPTILTDKENEKIGSLIYERLSFEIVKYYNSPDDSSLNTLNIMESKIL